MPLPEEYINRAPLRWKLEKKSYTATESGRLSLHRHYEWQLSYLATTSRTGIKIVHCQWHWHNKKKRTNYKHLFALHFCVNWLSYTSKKDNRKEAICLITLFIITIMYHTFLTKETHTSMMSMKHTPKIMNSYLFFMTYLIHLYLLQM